MQGEIRAGESDLKNREAFVKMKEEGMLVEPGVSALKCVRLVDRGVGGGGKSGEHLDFWDDIEGLE